MEQIPLARDLMRARSCHFLGPDMDVADGLALLVSQRASAVPVLDEGSRLVGILTEKDCLRLVANDAYTQVQFLRGQVSDFMSPIHHPLSPQMDLFTIASQFLKNNFHCLPVLEEGRIVGCISRHQLLVEILELERRRIVRTKGEREFQEIFEHPEARSHIESTAGSLNRQQLATILKRRKSI